jgi:hypothetical protein
VLLTGLFFTVPPLPFALIGLPVWIVTAWVSAALAGSSVPGSACCSACRSGPQPMPAGDRNPLRYGGINPGVRRRGAHQLLALPLGVLTSGITYFLLSGAVALLAMPVLTFLVPSQGATAFGIPFADTGGGRALLAGIGLVLLLLAPTVVRGLTALDASVARAGDVTASGLTGPITVDRVSGDVALFDLAGPVDVTSRSGVISGRGLRSTAVRATPTAAPATSASVPPADTAPLGVDARLLRSVHRPGQRGCDAGAVQVVEDGVDLGDPVLGKAQPTGHPRRVPRSRHALPPLHGRLDPELAQHSHRIVRGGRRRAVQTVEALPQRVEPRHRVLGHHLHDHSPAGCRSERTHERRQVDDVVQHVVGDDHVGGAGLGGHVGPATEDGAVREGARLRGRDEGVEHVLLLVHTGDVGDPPHQREGGGPSPAADVEHRAAVGEQLERSPSRECVHGLRWSHEKVDVVVKRVVLSRGEDLWGDAPALLTLRPHARRIHELEYAPRSPMSISGSAALGLPFTAGRP